MLIVKLLGYSYIRGCHMMLLLWNSVTKVKSNSTHTVIVLLINKVWKHTTSTVKSNTWRKTTWCPGTDSWAPPSRESVPPAHSRNTAGARCPKLPDTGIWLFSSSPPNSKQQCSDSSALELKILPSQFPNHHPMGPSLIHLMKSDSLRTTVFISWHRTKQGDVNCALVQRPPPHNRRDSGNMHSTT